jgi:transposase
MNTKKQTAESKVKEIRRHTRKKYSAEEKIRIVIEGLRGETSIAELCHKEGINANLYYNWSKDFMEAGKHRLAGDIKREATTTEVHDLKNENMDLKELVAELSLEVRKLKKTLLVPSKLQVYETECK